MVSSINGVSSYANQMNIQSMQQHREKIFNKVDSSSNGSVDQTEFDAFVVKLSERSGTSIDSASAFSTYDSDGDGSLNQDEMDTFMKENAPPPPPPPSSGAGSMQNAISAYTSASSSSDSTSSLLAELLDQISSTSSSTGETMDLQNKYISELIQSMGTQSSQYTYSPIDLKA